MIDLHYDALYHVFKFCDLKELSILLDVCQCFRECVNNFVKHRWKSITLFQFCGKFTKVNDELLSELNMHPFKFILEKFGLLLQFVIVQEGIHLLFSTFKGDHYLFESKCEYSFNKFSFHLDSSSQRLELMSFFNPLPLEGKLIPKNSDSFRFQHIDDALHIFYDGGIRRSMYKLHLSHVCNLCKFSPHEIKGISQSKFFPLFLQLTLQNQNNVEQNTR